MALSVRYKRTITVPDYDAAMDPVNEKLAEGYTHVEFYVEDVCQLYEATATAVTLIGWLDEEMLEEFPDILPHQGKAECERRRRQNEDKDD